MSSPRYVHTATLLPSGKVLIAGGSSGVSPFWLSTAEIYDPSAAQFTSTGSMNAPRALHTATLLGDGTVLIAGGTNSDPISVGQTAELYDPTSGSFAATGNMMLNRQDHTATLLPNGKVLIVGSASTLDTHAELYDPISHSFAFTGSTNIARANHTATLLGNGKVLITGGRSTTPFSAEIYDPNTGVFTSTGNMTTPRYFHTATLLADGRVLIVGGTDGTNALSTAELYDPITGLFALTGATSVPHSNHTATVLQNGEVLITGGQYTCSDPPLCGVGLVTADAELYNATTGAFTPTATMTTPRALHTATKLPGGNVLMAGGVDGATFLFSAELFQPAAAPPPVISSISPTSGTQGQTIGTFVINGSNFDPAATLSFGGTGINVNSYSSRTTTQIVASISVGASAPLGAQDVTITNSNGQQGTLLGAFQIISACRVGSVKIDRSFSNGVIDASISTSGLPCTFTITLRNLKNFWTNFKVSTVGFVTIAPVGGNDNLYAKYGLLPPSGFFPLPPGQSVSYLVTVSNPAESVTVLADPTFATGAAATEMNGIQGLLTLIPGGGLPNLIISDYQIILNAFENMPHLLLFFAHIFHNRPQLGAALKEFVLFLTSSAELSQFASMSAQLGLNIGVAVLKAALRNPLRIINYFITLFGNLRAAFFEYPAGSIAFIAN